MNVSVLFFTLLISAQVAFSQTDEIAMIQKSQQGTEVLNHIYLEVAAQGAEMNVESVRAVLRGIEDETRSNLAASVENSKVVEAECTDLIAQARERMTDLVRRATTVARRHGMAVAAHKATVTLHSRAEEEVSGLRKQKEMMLENLKNWANFWKIEKGSYNKVKGLISTVQSHIGTINRSTKNTALIQLPHAYRAALAQVKVEFAGEYSELNGLRPIITNLIAVVEDTKNLNNDVVMEKANGLFTAIREYLNDEQDKLAEQNSHQMALYQAANQLFGSAVERSQKIVDRLTGVMEEGEKQIEYLAQEHSAADQFVQQATSVVDNFLRGCAAKHDASQLLVADSQRMLDIVDQVRVTINDKWQAVSTFFIEKMHSEI